MPLAVHSQTPKQVSGNFDKKSRDCLPPNQFRKSKAAEEQVTKMQKKKVVFLEMAMGVSVPECGRQRRGGLVDMDDEGRDEEP